MAFSIPGAGSTFFGFISDSAFTSVNIVGGATGSGFYVMDDVSISRISAVPAPSALLLLAAGIAAFGARRRFTK